MASSRFSGLALATALLLSGPALGQYDDGRYGPAPYGDYSHRRPVQDVHREPVSTPAAQDGYDWARVVRVDPVFDDGRPAGDPRCHTRRDDGYVYDDGHRNDPYRNDGYRNDGYRNDGYDQGDRGYRDDGYGRSRRDENGSMVATVLGGIAGAVLGSQVGGGSGRYVGTAVGSMVGGIAGRGIYEASRRGRDGYVTVCEPDPYRQTGSYPGDWQRGVERYDVTYEYAGRRYTTRTSYHPGDRIRVRVDVRPE